MLIHIFRTATLTSLLSAAFVLPLLGLPSFNQAIAQTPQESNDSVKPTKLSAPVISSEKRALIKELLEITESGKNAQQIMDTMVRAELPKLVSTVLENVPALNSDRPEVQKKFSDLVSRMAVKYRDRVVKKIDLGQLIEQISYPIYDKYFTESELLDIIGFYKSSTGKKTISILPQLTVESMSRTNEILLPKITSIMSEIITEELATLIKK